MMNRAGREEFGTLPAQVFILIGDLHEYYLRKALRASKPLGFYYFSRVFENSDLHGESGLHKHITEVIIGDPFKHPHPSDPSFHHLVFPTSAKLDFSLESYSRLRRSGRRRGQAPFPEFTKMASG
jgi:hypothetical protein